MIRTDRPRRWMVLFPGNVYANGPTTGYYTSEREARGEIRRVWNLDRLPRGAAVWPTDEWWKRP